VKKSYFTSYLLSYSTTFYLALQRDHFERDFQDFLFRFRRQCTPPQQYGVLIALPARQNAFQGDQADPPGSIFKATRKNGSLLDLAEQQSRPLRGLQGRDQLGSVLRGEQVSRGRRRD